MKGSIVNLDRSGVSAYPIQATHHGGRGGNKCNSVSIELHVITMQIDPLSRIAYSRHAILVNEVRKLRMVASSEKPYTVRSHGSQNQGTLLKEPKQLL